MRYSMALHSGNAMLGPRGVSRSLLTLLTMAPLFLIFYRPSTLDAGLRRALDIFLGGGSSQLHSPSAPSWRRDPMGDSTGH